MHVTFATIVKECTRTLANYSVEIWKVRRIRAPELLGFICEVEHPSDAVVVNEFWVLLLLLMLLGFTHLLHA